MKQLLTPLFLIFLFHNGISQNVVKVNVNASREVGEMIPLWAYFGYDEPNSTYTANGKKLLKELAQLSPVPVYLRTHNMLTTKEGNPDLKWGFTNAYTEDKKGRPIYDWTIVDSIVDTYVSGGMKPLMEIGFMPKAMSTNPEPYQHFWSAKGEIWTGWTYPPKDYKKWAELTFQWVKHSIKRYGQEEVDTWLWQVWNEPNIGYWSGTFDEYCKLYDFAADAVKRACPTCTVGGPHTTNPDNEKSYNYLKKFLDHCINGKNYATGKIGSPIEYVAFHAKGSPTLVDGHIRMNMANQLNSLAKGFEAVNSFPELKDIPVIIGEFDPEGCAACSEEREPKYAYRNGTVYPSYMASSIAKCYELMDSYDVNLVGALSWAFEFEGQKYFAGFRDLATNGIDKPVLNVFRMMGMMNGQRLESTSERSVSAAEIIEKQVLGDSEIGVIASSDEKSIAIMVWNYHDDDVAADASNIELKIEGLTQKKVLMHHYRIDNQFSNSFEKWKSMGSPTDMTDKQYKTLEQSGQLEMFTSPQWVDIKESQQTIDFSLPRQGVSLIRLTW